MTAENKNLPVAGLINLLVVYLAWGSTYLAIRVAVMEGSGIPPFWLGTTRVFAASPILILLSLILRQKIKINLSEFKTLAISGLLMWVGGNGLVNWAEVHVDSGLAALVVGTMPFWTSAMEAILNKKAPSKLLIFSLLIGFAGLIVLTVPVLRTGVKADILGLVALVIAPISWGIGSMMIQRRPVKLKPMGISAYQQFFGGIGFLLIALLIREPFPDPTPSAFGAWIYLVIVGSLLAFTSFVYALRLLPISIVMTYAYVNPVIAVILGWLILGESITIWTVAGMLLILSGVYGVFRDRLK